MLDILFAGTGASIPSRNRSLPCVAVKQGRSLSLFDCGEGSQRQLMLSRFSFMRVDRIFITHMHGDHMLGLPGLLQTMGMSGRTEPVDLYGPAGIASAISGMLDACEGGLEFELIVREVVPGETFQFDGFSVSTFETVHGCPSMGYLYRESDRPGSFNKDKAIRLGLEPKDFSKLQRGETVNGVRPSQVIGSPRPGCSLAYTGDTVLCDTVREAVKGVDVLIHECTYMDADAKLAEDHFHSTAGNVARMASEAGVRNLMMVHVSNRYGEGQEVLEEAKGIFENSYLPNDLDICSLKPGGLISLSEDPTS